MNWRTVSPYMTEDEAWNEAADLEMLGIHYNLEERMDYREHKARLMKDPEFRKAYEALKYDTICRKCDGLIARPGVTYGYSGDFCCCPDERATLDGIERDIEALFERVAEVALRHDFDSEEIEGDIAEAVEAVRDTRLLLKEITEAAGEVVRLANVMDIDMDDYEYDPVAKVHFLKPEKRKIIEEYANYAKQEIRFCPYCGAALGIV